MKEKKLEIEDGKITGFFDKNTEIKGDLKFSGSFQIDGHFTGTIDSNAILVIGENGKVEADVKIGVIVINGEIKGNIHALQKVEINPRGRLIGTVTVPNLVVREGAYLEANCHTTEKSPPAQTGDVKKTAPEKETELKKGFLS